MILEITEMTYDKSQCTHDDILLAMKNVLKILHRKLRTIHTIRVYTCIYLLMSKPYTVVVLCYNFLFVV